MSKGILDRINKKRRFIWGASFYKRIGETGIFTLRVLQQRSIRPENQFLLDCEDKIKNKIVIGKNSKIHQTSKITGPVIIGKNCIIGSNVKLGPNVSVGDNCILNQCIIEDSIIMKNCNIDSKIILSKSIIANNSIIDSSPSFTKNQFLLGERSNIKLQS